MKKALCRRVPRRMPQVSRLARVFWEACCVKEWRRGVGRKIVRRGAPDSRHEVVANWWLVGGAVEGAGMFALVGTGGGPGEGGCRYSFGGGLGGSSVEVS